MLEEMEKEIEAAMTLGASPVQIFMKVILPTLIPSIITGGALSFSRALGEFGSVVIVAGNIPFKTQVAAVYVYGEIESSNVRVQSVSFILLACSFAVLLLLNFIQYWNGRHEEVIEFSWCLCNGSACWCSCLCRALCAKSGQTACPRLPNSCDSPRPCGLSCSPSG
ncbi:MAG: ABC transporter permease subunit [Marinilabiliales bacterium]|nr:ABC transporter permease subunit [Marinilabiliales bacterium]